MWKLADCPKETFEPLSPWKARYRGRLIDVEDMRHWGNLSIERLTKAAHDYNQAVYGIDVLLRDAYYDWSLGRENYLRPKDIRPGESSFDFTLNRLFTLRYRLEWVMKMGYKAYSEWLAPLTKEELGLDATA